MGPSWETIDFKVQTTEVDPTTQRIYANGNMQAHVVVSVRAIDPADNEPYHLTQDELNSIMLVDLDGPLKPLSSPCGASFDENIYDHKMTGSGSKQYQALDTAETPKEGFDKVSFWVTTARVESKNIGVQIRQPGGAMVDTSGADDFDSHVTLVGVAPRPISFEDLRLSGETEIHREESWRQANFYLSIRDREVRYMECPGLENAIDDHEIASFQDCGFSDFVMATNFFCWPPGERRTVTLHTRDLGDIPSIINQEKNHGCLTRVSMTYTGQDHGHALWVEGELTVYDQCGTAGSCYPKYPNRLYLELSKWQYQG